MDEFKNINSVENDEACGEQEKKAAELFTQLPEEEEKPKKNPWYYELYEWAQSITFAVVIALFINQFVFALVQVEGNSMLPTLHDSEKLVVTKLFYEPKRQDIVVVESKALGKFIIKRVIAVPGDVIDIDPLYGEVTVNGQVLDEPYIAEKLKSDGGMYQYPITIPEDFVFVLGDNRNHSNDSRMLGLIAFDDVVGRASLRLTPFSRFGGLYDELKK